MESFDQWVNNEARNHMDVWYTSETVRHGVTHRVIIGMSDTFLQLFNTVIDHLKELHQNNRYHGNIRNSVQISSFQAELVRQPGWISPVVVGQPHRRNNKPFTITHVNIVQGSGVGYSTTYGILKDVEDLRFMVEEVVNLFPEQIALWTLFHTGAIYRRPAAQVLNLWTVKKMALYNYSHPIFLNKAGSCNFVHKLHEIRRRNTARFNRDVCLDTTQRDSDMSNWHLLLDHHPLHSPLRSVLFDRSNFPPTFQTRYANSFQFPLYMRVVCVHGRDCNPQAWAGEVFRELREVFPDGLPKIHWQLCTKLNVDGHCVAYYGADIFRLIGHGPHGYPGFKV